jgi:MerR HTH family regulatory protein
MAKSGKSQPDSGLLVSASELAEVIGIDLETVNNWLRRGVLTRARVGGRQLRSRLFSTEEVYRAALINELVNLGLQPSSASEAVGELWNEWSKLDVPKPKNVYALLMPREGGWSIELCSQNLSRGPLYKMRRSAAPKSAEAGLPKQGFAVLPISDILDCVTAQVSQLLKA